MIFNKSYTINLLPRDFAEEMFKQGSGILVNISKKRVRLPVDDAGMVECAVDRFDYEDGLEAGFQLNKLIVTGLWDKTGKRVNVSKRAINKFIANVNKVRKDGR